MASGRKLSAIPWPVTRLTAILTLPLAPSRQGRIRSCRSIAFHPLAGFNRANNRMGRKTIPISPSPSPEGGGNFTMREKLDYWRERGL